MLDTTNSVPGVPGAPPEEEVQAQAAKREAGPAAEHQIHVRGIGVEGWDGTEDGVGTYENEDALGQIFAAFGGFVHASIRHRIADGQNTSWALVTMADAESVDRTPPHCWHLGLHRERYDRCGQARWLRRR